MATARKVSSNRKKAVSKARPARAAKPAAPEPPATPRKPEKAAKPAKTKTAKPAKPAKPAKAQRDTFRMPVAEFDLLRTLKSRAKSLGVPAKKSDILRAGLRTLQRMDDEHYAVLLASVQGSA